MAEQRPGREFAKVAGITLVVLLALYMGSYYWLVEAEIVPDPAGAVWSVQPDYRGRFGFPRKQFWNRVLTPLFSPVHWLDRRIRSELWSLDDVFGA